MMHTTRYDSSNLMDTYITANGNTVIRSLPPIYPWRNPIYIQPSIAHTSRTIDYGTPKV